MAHASRLAWVTLLTKNEYLPGVLVLFFTLRMVNSKYPLVVMAPPKLSQEARNVLRKLGIIVRDVEYLRSNNTGFTDKRFSDTWTKIRVWELLEYERVVLIDSDVLIKRNMDELLENLELGPGEVAAAHVCACNPRKLSHYPRDWLPGNCAYTAVASPMSPPPEITLSSPRPFGQLNSGVVVLRPSKESFERLHDNLTNNPAARKWIFPDQDLIATVFKGKWKPLPWYYNALRTLQRVHPRLWKEDEIRCLHYILGDKPWHSRLMVQDQVFGRTNQWWWNAWDDVINELKDTHPSITDFVSRFVDNDRDWRP